MSQETVRYANFSLSTQKKFQTIRIPSKNNITQIKKRRSHFSYRFLLELYSSLIFVDKGGGGRDLFAF